MAQSSDEKIYVEIPFIEQLRALGWKKGLQSKEWGQVYY